MAFHPRCGGDVIIQDGRTAERRNKVKPHDTLVFTRDPLRGDTFTVRVDDTTNNGSVQVIIGVTQEDPAGLHTVPGYPLYLPQSWCMWGYDLCKDASKGGSCPELCVSPGDTLGIQHKNSAILFYKNDALHYKWEINVPAPVWGFVWMWEVTRMSFISPAPLHSSIPEWAGENRKEIYRMTSQPRGFAVIVNMAEVFGHEDREGSDTDVTNLQVTWGRLGYDVITWINKGSIDLHHGLNNLSQNSALSSHDSLVLILMSHGRKGQILASDGVPVQLGQIFWTFGNKNCPQLRNKPKLFFISACRGDDKERDLSDSDEETVNEAMRLPSLSDMLVMYSTNSGFKSWRNAIRGTYLIEALCKVFDKHSHEKELHHLLIKMIAEVRSARNQNTQSPIYKSTLAKQLWFYPVNP